MRVLLYVAGVVASDPSLGPGPFSWPHAAAEEVGLNSSALLEAANEISGIGSPLCLSVVKDGRLVMDRAFAGFGQAHRVSGFETMSVGKTFTAALVGAAVYRGLFDLDTPIAKYGVKPYANWNLTGIDYFPNVTARHLISQSSGVGRYPPGRNLTYDSDNYIQHLSYLLNATVGTNMTAREWATNEFAAKLGLPHWYSYQGGDPLDIGGKPERDINDEISAGGDQPVNCSSLARLGQLLLNRGMWLERASNTSDLTPVRLLASEFVDAMFTPQMPPDCGPGYPANQAHMCSQYSYLSYVATNNSAPAPGCRACDASNNGLVKILGMPNGALMGLGQLGRYLIVLPEDKLVVVAFMSAQAKFYCDGANGSKIDGNWATWEGLLLTQIWQHLRNAATGANGTADEGWSSGHQSGTATSATSATWSDRSVPSDDVAPASAHASGNLHDASGGACYCYCPGDQAIGHCVANVSSNVACAGLAKSNSSRQFCPPITLMKDCIDNPTPCHGTPREDGLNKMKLVAVKNCTAESPPALTMAQQCTYEPVGFAECVYSAGSYCTYSPYFG